MTKWLNQWETKADDISMERDEAYCGYTNRSSIRTVLRRVSASDIANLPRMALYSLRHRGTTVSRAAKVPKEQIDCQLAMSSRAPAPPRTTEYEPDYLTVAAAALDAWISRILKLSRKLSAKDRKAA